MIKTERIKEKVKVTLEGETIAESTNAIKLYEPGHDPVIYIPKNDLKEIDLIQSSKYHCPLKGDAEIYTIRHGAHDIEEGAWSYSEPFKDLSELMGRVAFYPDKVQKIELSSIPFEEGQG